jgi:membrane protease subunit HflC
MDAMRRNLLRWLVAAVVVIVVVASSVFYSLREGQVAVVTRFGAPRAVVTEAGLHVKWPWPVERANLVDARRRLFNSRFAETLTQDKKNIILRTFVVWSVADPLTFLQSMGDPTTAEARLDGLVTNAKNAVLGSYPLSALVSTEPGALRVEEVENRIREDVEATARKSFGIRLHQVGLKQLGLPADNVPQIFDRMRAEREKVAARYKAEGEREASRIRSETDLAVARLRADGRRQALEIRGAAEAEAASIYREAHRRDPEFYRFLRRIDALKNLFGERTSLVFRTDEPPFDLLKLKPLESPGGSGAAGSEKGGK